MNGRQCKVQGAGQRHVEPASPALALRTVGQLPRSYDATAAALRVARVTFQRQ